MDALVHSRDATLASLHAVTLDGACSINGGPDVSCCAVEMSLTTLIVLTEASVVFADAVTLQLPQIGIVEAAVAEVLEGGFRLVFEGAPMSKLGTYVTWLERSDASEDGFANGRQHERIVPIKRLTTLRRVGSAPSMARLVDLSRSGAAFTCGKPPKVGERVDLGAYGGIVVRLIEGGAAVRFDGIIDERDFSVLIDLDVAASTEHVA